MGVDVKTVSRWQRSIEDKRQGPKTVPANKLSPEECAKVISTATLKKYMDLPPSQIVPMLADEGRYIASESSFYRILKKEKMLSHRGKSKPAVKKKPKALIATAPNQVYSWDITYLHSSVRGRYYYLYMFMDLFSRKIVGSEVHEVESMALSSAMVNKICIKEGIQKNQLTLHSDNGGPMKGATMLATLQRLEIVSSLSRPSVSNDNPYSESLFKTLKYRPWYPSKPFDSIESAQEWVKNFVCWYNEDHLHSGINFISPNDKHNNLDGKILKKRNAVYEKAKLKNKNRWSGKTRNWNVVTKVYLNHLQKEEVLDIKIAS